MKRRQFFTPARVFAFSFSSSFDPCVPPVSPLHATSKAISLTCSCSLIPDLDAMQSLFIASCDRVPVVSTLWLSCLSRCTILCIQRARAAPPGRGRLWIRLHHPPRPRLRSEPRLERQTLIILRNNFLSLLDADFRRAQITSITLGESA